MKKIEEGLYLVGGRSAAVITATSRFSQNNLKIEYDSSDSEVASWGDDNLYPQNFLKKFNKTDAAVGGFEVLSTAHYGNGFKIFKQLESGDNIVLKEQLLKNYPEIQEFFKLVKFGKMMTGLIMDYEMWRLGFPEYLLSPDGNKIISIKRHPAAWCRFAMPKNGIVTKVHINSDWETNNKDLTAKVDLIPYDLASAAEIKEYAKEKRLKSFILPIRPMMMVEKLYPVVGFHSAFNNKWVDTVLSVPEFKQMMFENQLNFKFLVYVSDEFMVRKYGQEDWMDFTAAEKEAKRQELVNQIDGVFRGNQGSGRSLTSPYFRDQNGNMIKGIEVVPVDDKIKDGNFLPDAAAGNSQILFAMGVDPSLIGAGIPGGKNLSGSGSDKREAYTVLCSKMPFKRTSTVEVFDTVRDYNEWDPDLIGNFPNQNLTTLDNNPNGVKEITL